MHPQGSLGFLHDPSLGLLLIGPEASHSATIHKIEKHIAKSSSLTKGGFIMSENITEKRHGTVLLVLELDMIEDLRISLRLK